MRARAWPKRCSLPKAVRRGGLGLRAGVGEQRNRKGERPKGGAGGTHGGTSRGAIARRLPYNYAQGLGLWKTDDQVPGARVTEALYSEENARTLYGRWAAFMDATSWADLAPAGEGHLGEARVRGAAGPCHP